MKFKLIFALFNGIILISFLFVFLMPLFILGLENTAGFWGQNWYLILVFVGILGVLDLYFFVNWQTFQLLEREDWSGLSAHLEQRIFNKGSLSDQGIRLLCNAWVVQGKPMEIMRLEQHLKLKRPSLVQRYGLLLGIPYLMKNEADGMISFFAPLANNPRAGDQQWMKFNHAFGLLAKRQIAESVQILESLGLQKKERIVQLLALYLLDSNSAATVNSGANPAINAAVAEFRKKFSQASFAKYIERFRENLQVIILSKFIGEAADWIFATPQIANNN